MDLIPTFGNALYTIGAFVVALSVIVAVHEYGHYIVGRWSGIDAEVFSIGFGPVIFARTDRRGTRWQVAALPLGGYVKFLGDSDAASGRDGEAIEALTEDTRRRTMHGAPLWARAATVAAGPLFNFALSIIVFAAILMLRGVAADPLTVEQVREMPGGVELLPGDRVLAVEGMTTPPLEELDAFAEELPRRSPLDYEVGRDGATRVVEAPHLYPPLVSGITPNSAAADVDMRVGDVILSVDGRDIATFAELRDIVGQSDGRPLLFEVWNDGETRDVVVVPRRMDMPLDEGGFETRWLVGISSGLLFEPQTAMPSPVDAIGYGVDQTAFIIRSSLSGLYHMAAGAISSCNLRGPIGIAQTSGAAGAPTMTRSAMPISTPGTKGIARSTAYRTIAVSSIGRSDTPGAPCRSAISVSSAAPIT